MKKLLTKMLIIVIVIAVMASAVYGLMVALGVNTIDGLREAVAQYGWWAYAIIVVLQIIQVVFIPISNQIITIPAIAVIGVWPAFFCSWIGIEIGTIALYLIGRYGGGPLLRWLISDKDKVDKFKKMVTERKLFYPVGMLIGVIPDDLLTTVAGVARISFWYVLIVSIVTRGICVLTTVFGFGILTQTWWGIVILAIGSVLIAVAGYIFLRYEPQIERWWNERHEKRRQIDDTEDIGR